MTINKNDLITSRDMIPEDKNFIMATWLRGLYYGGSVFSDMKKQTFMAKYHGVIESILDRSHVRVACLIEDPKVILSYSVFSLDKNAIHWAFSKKSWRGIGLIKDLVPLSVTKTTHLTKVGLSITKRKGLEFDPFYSSR